ncbi:stalk domain-containing protein [Paenibacillus oralis]|uniref:stalk domain-containing protein n=1 Tax=Paenibacillus oralis TaxID=2490856 RepID=UPI0015ABE0D6|nr:chromosome condensation regulator RCC1 [Paenibacillus oralis]
METGKRWVSGFLAAVLAVTVGASAWVHDAGAASSVQPVSAAGGFGHGVAAWSDGSVTGWGYNKFGQVGDGTSIDQFVPKTIAGLPEIVQVQAGERTSFAVSKDGEVWAWGDFYSRYVSGDPILPYQKRGEPVKVEQLQDVRRLAYSDPYASIAIHKDGTATLWYPSFQEDYKSYDIKLTPLKGFTNVQDAVIAGYEAVVLTEGGNVGTLNLYNSYYDRYRTESELKEVKPLVSSIEQMAVSARDVFFLHQNGSILRWNADTKEPPAVVKNLSGVKDIKEIKTGYNRLYMLKDNGTVWQWDYNTGQSAKPFQVQGLTGIKTIEGTYGQTGYAISKNGKLLAWGDGYYSGMGTDSSSQQIKEGGIAQVLPPFSFKVNGQNVQFYATAAIVDGKLYVPYSSVFEALGVKTKTVQSNPDPKNYNRTYSVISFSYNGQTVAFKRSDRTVLLVNGKASKEEVDLPFLANSTLYPLELICEKLGIPLDWNRETGEVRLGESSQ